jgi:UDP-glucose 4-epimerase
MKALILGGNGFIGSHPVEVFLGGGRVVRVFDGNKELYRRPTGGVEYFYADFQELHTAGRSRAKHGCHLCI